MMLPDTVLSITGVGFPPYAVRGLTQNLNPIIAATQQRRTVNGELINLADSLFQKYESTIVGDDQQPPAVDGIWPGLTVTVDCIVELCVQSDDPTSTETETVTEGALGRTAVPGSVRVADGFTFYRPRLTMLINSFNVNRDEWGAVVSWTMQLEEV